jgi:hypothetical protein
MIERSVPENCPARLDDPRIRNALVPALRTRHSGALVLHEMPLRNTQAIIDVVAIDEALHAYEIKSDLDSLRRLKRQATYYDRTFDDVTLVTTRPMHAQVIPDHWGLASVRVGTTSIEIDWIREAKQNQTARSEDLLYILRASELNRILRANGQSRVSALSKAQLVRGVIGLLGEEGSRIIGTEVLRLRRSWSERQLGVEDEGARLQHALSQAVPRLSILSQTLF